jgi:hypothetical protein
MTNSASRSINPMAARATPMPGTVLVSGSGTRIDSAGHDQQRADDAGGAIPGQAREPRVRQLFQPSAIALGAGGHIEQACDRQLPLAQRFGQPRRTAARGHLNGKHHHGKRDQLRQEIDEGQAAGQGKHQQQQPEGALLHQVDRAPQSDGGLDLAGLCRFEMRRQNRLDLGERAARRLRLLDVRSCLQSFPDLLANPSRVLAERNGAIHRDPSGG